MAAMQRAIPCLFMRGGTSRGPFFAAADLPADIAARDRVLLAVMGSPDARQIDGLGGAHPLTSKVGIVSRGSKPGVDLDFLFAQLQPAKDTVDTTPNCGNMLAAVLPGFVQSGQGHVSLVGSVAGYRGLPKALAYGPSKAALINFAETLYLDLAPRGVSVFIINPGFVATPLTAQNDFDMPALISAEDAARRIVRGFAGGAFEIHFPQRFTRVMKLLRWLPDRLYFSLVSRGTRS